MSKRISHQYCTLGNKDQRKRAHHLTCTFSASRIDTAPPSLSNDRILISYACYFPRFGPRLLDHTPCIRSEILVVCNGVVGMQLRRGDTSGHRVSGLTVCLASTSNCEDRVCSRNGLGVVVAYELRVRSTQSHGRRQRRSLALPLSTR